MPVRFRVNVLRDLQYAAPSGVPLNADLYLPEHTGAAVPVIVWVHGGGWRYGNRRMSPDLARTFAERGLAAAAIDYRLSNRATFPAQVHDVRTAIGWLRSIAPTYGLDGHRIGLAGVSAGGHLCALAGLAPEDAFHSYHAPSAGHSTRVRAVVVGYAPIDFLQLDDRRAPDTDVSEDPENLPMPRGMQSADANSFESMLLGAPIGSCPDRVRAANPITYARPDAPPFLILHGASDTTVPLHQSEILFEALAACGNDVTLCVIDKLGHGFLSRKHLDDAPPRRMTLRRTGERRPEQREQAVFPFVEGFFRTHLFDKTGPRAGIGGERDANPA